MRKESNRFYGFARRAGQLWGFLTGLALGAASPAFADAADCILVMRDPPLILQAAGGRSPSRPVSRDSPFQAAALAREGALRSAQDGLTRELRRLDPEVRVKRRFVHVLNAMLVSLDRGRWSEVRSLPGVAHLAPVRTVRPSLTHSGGLMRLPGAWDRLGGMENAGRGVLIAVIDTGVDITHPSFNPDGFSYPEGFPKGDAAFTNPKVVVARSFPPAFGNPGNTTPYDLEGHGTDVASLAASVLTNSPLGFLSGVAPGAHIGNYKIFTGPDGADSGQVIAAVEQAVLDGARVLNMSFGQPLFGDPMHEPQLMAIQNAIDAGVTAVIAAGNDGRAFTIGSPQQLRDAITVGSVSNAHDRNGLTPVDELRLTARADGEAIVDGLPAILAGGGGAGNDPLEGPYETAVAGEFPLLDADLLDGGGYGGFGDGLMCGPLPEGASAEGAWLLVQRGDCVFVDKIGLAREAGAAGVLLYDNEEDAVPVLPFVEGTTIPSMLIERAEGLRIKAAIREGRDVTIELLGEPVSDRGARANVLARSSSLGPSVDYQLKPDIVSVGQGSFGATQNDSPRTGNFKAGGFDWYTGTSMSTPRVAGLAAILHGARPDWPADWIKSALMLAARPEVTLVEGGMAGPAARGAGAADAERLLRIDTLALPAALGFGAWMPHAPETGREWLRIVNASEETREYTLEAAAGGAGGRIGLSRNGFALEPGESTEIEATLAIDPSMPEGGAEGVIILEDRTAGQSYSIPFWAQIMEAPPAEGGVLLVDDDKNSSFEQYYIDRLNELEIPFTLWSVSSRGGYPVLNYLKAFNTVIWQLSDKSLDDVEDENSRRYEDLFNPWHLFETALTRYLAEGGSLLLSGQDYFDDREAAAFPQEVLQVFPLDFDGGAATVAGVAGSPIAEGIGPVTLSFPAGLENGVDRVRELGRGVVKAAFSSDGNPRRTVGVTVESCAARAVFLAFPLEALPAETGRAVLERSLEWLGGETSETAPRLDGASPASIEASSERPSRLTVDGGGFVTPSGYRAYLGSNALGPVTRNDCGSLSVLVPPGLAPGRYTLRVVTGSGHDIRLPDAVEIVDAPPTAADGWGLHETAGKGVSAPPDGR